MPPLNQTLHSGAPEMASKAFGTDENRDRGIQPPARGEPQLSHGQVAGASRDAIRIKICGVTTIADALACATLGADMIGLNFYPKSARCIQPETARAIVEAVPSDLQSVGVFVDGDAEIIRQIAQTAGVRAVQLHGHISPDACRDLARDFRVIRAFCTDTCFQPTDVLSFRHCDILLDAHHPHLRGGTGLTCDWAAARAALPYARFLILSGGLNAHNAPDAIAAVAPDAVDVCSAVERAPGIKDHSAIKDFIAAVRGASRPLKATPA
jgi:phosphoribosylanthranilate isomerase